MSTWRVSRDGHVRGPFTEAQIFEQVGRATVGRGDYVSFDEGPWVRIDDTHVFGPMLPALPMGYGPPPAPGYHYPSQHQYHQPIMVMAPAGCPRCGAVGSKITTSAMSSSGWVVFFVFLLLCLFVSIYALIAMRETRSHCSRCGALL